MGQPNPPQSAPPPVANTSPPNNPPPDQTQVGSPEFGDQTRRPDLNAGITDSLRNPGASTSTNQLLRDAQKTIGNLFNGQVSAGAVVGRDLTFNVGSSTARAVAYSVDGDQVALTQHAFVRDAGYAALWADCGRRRLVIVQGPRGSGKTAAALRVLHERQHSEFFVFGARVPFDLIKDAAHHGAGHLIENAPDDHVRLLDARMLSDLDKELAGMDASLIITISDSVAFVDPDLAKFVVPFGPPTAHHSILEAHLRFRLGDAKALDQLSVAEFTQLFDDLVKPDSARSRTAEFAFHTAQLAARGDVDLNLLRARMSGSIAAEVEGWFNGIADEPLECLAIAIALLDDLPYQTVESAADSLLRRVAPPPSPNHINPPPPRPKLGGSGGTRSRLNRVRARTVSKTLASRFGDVTAEVVQFNDPGFPREVLDLVWREFPLVHDDLLNWLTDLANHPDDAVRVRAATAVGTIAVSAFDHIYQRVLRPWANSPSVRKRDMAAYALSGPGQTDQMRRQIRLAVDEWSTDDEWRLRATAARVFGAALGASDLTRAFEKLDAIAATETILSDPDDKKGPQGDIALAISESICELVDADPALALRAVEQAQVWMRDQRRKRTAAGEITFLGLAADLVTAHGGAGVEWPTLLSLSTGSQPLRNAVAASWQQCLNSRYFHSLARLVAGSWALRVEPDPAARAAYAQILSIAAVGHERTTKIILLSLVRTWKDKSDPGYAPETARAVEYALS